jgi:coenzyme F420-0:L-glutamate ligase
MQFIPVKTRIINPPKDDLFAVLDEYLTSVQEGDVVLISSKVVAIDEGRCMLASEMTDKNRMIEEEADLVIPRTYRSTPLSVVHSAFIGTAGIDESNAGGYLVFLPKDPFASAQGIHTYLKKRFNLTNVGVVITDSHSQPMRYGAAGISIGFWGFEPVLDCVGEEDLFGREMKIEKANIADGLAAGATVVMGEVAQCQPVVIARDVPDLIFVEGSQKNRLFVPLEDDTFRVLYERFMK